MKSVFESVKSVFQKSAFPQSAFLSRRSRQIAFAGTQIYPVVSSEFCSREPLETVEQLLAAGTHLVQLREKSMPTRRFVEYARAVREIANRHRALVIIDDRVDVALAANADGVHLGNDDLSVPDARAIAPDLLLGVSTHNEAELLAAQNLDCDYLNIGPIFATQTKAVSFPPIGLDELARLAKLVRIPFSVMGGIKPEHVPALRAIIGGNRIAAVTAFTRAVDIASAVERFG